MSIKLKLKRLLHQHKMKKYGYIDHHTTRQTVVSGKELVIQVEEMWREENLLRCIVLGREHPDYKKYLYLVSLKFEVVSGLVVADKNGHLSKLPLHQYEEYLFTDFIGDEEEMSLRLDAILKENKESDNTELATRAYKIYNAVCNVCCTMMAHVADTATLCEFAHYIDHIIGVDGNIPELEYGKCSMFPDNLPSYALPSALQNEFEKYKYRE